MKLKAVLNKVIWSLLGILGFNMTNSYGEELQNQSNTPSSTNQRESEDSRVVCMYGVPSAKYVFKGNVTDPQGLPIANAQVQFFLNRQQMATISTDQEGSFSFSETDEPCDITITATAEQYASKEMVIPFDQMDFKNGNGRFYAGETVQELNITLDKEQK